MLPTTMSCKHLRKLRNSAQIFDAYQILCSSVIYPKTEHERRLKVSTFVQFRAASKT